MPLQRCTSTRHLQQPILTVQAAASGRNLHSSGCGVMQGKGQGVAGPLVQPRARQAARLLTTLAALQWLLPPPYLKNRSGEKSGAYAYGATNQVAPLLLVM